MSTSILASMAMALGISTVPPHGAALPPIPTYDVLEGCIRRAENAGAEIIDTQTEPAVMRCVSGEKEAFLFLSDNWPKLAREQRADCLHRVAGNRKRFMAEGAYYGALATFCPAFSGRE